MVLHAVAAATAAVALALGAAPPASPAPPATAQTAAPGTAKPLPEIGRVRANSPGCAAMRDLIIPAFAAAQRADMRFAQTRVRLPQYVEFADDPVHTNDIFRTSALAKLDADATTILNETLAINKALGDPRLKDTSDPVIAVERAALQQLYDMQQARANQLQQFVMRERNVVAQHGMEDSGAFRRRKGPATRDADPPPSAIPATTGPPGMPVLNGKIAGADKVVINQWSTAMAASVRASENQAAEAFYPIADGCR
jgi:hypothetical protein